MRSTGGRGAAYLTSSVGLSLALGAFLVGLIISESEYGLQALSDILPFRDAFSGIFFISLKEWKHRTAPEEQYGAILKHVNAEFAKIPAARAFAFSPPAIPGIGTSGGGSNDAGHLLADARLAMQVSPLAGRPLHAREVLTAATRGSALGLGRAGGRAERRGRRPRPASAKRLFTQPKP